MTYEEIDKYFKLIDQDREGLTDHQRRCPLCKEVVTSYVHLEHCSCGFLSFDAGSLTPDGKGARVLIYPLIE